MRIICGLGNPGAEYAATRHNVGWWLVEHAQRELGTSPFRQLGPLLVSEGRCGDQDVLLLEPLTYMNRSGTAVAPIVQDLGLDASRELLVVVDDSALDVGRVRFRARGSSGGHNGLRSIESELGSSEYARLRIGVGAAPPQVDLAAWVLAPFDANDAHRVTDMLPELTAAVRVWIEQGVEAAANRYNR